MVAPDEYRDRFAHAMTLAGVDMREVAKQLKTSTNAIKKVLNGDTNSLTAQNNSLAADFLKVDPDWLARGVGKPRAERVWPFQSLSLEQWHNAPAVLRQGAENMLLGQDASKVVPIKHPANAGKSRGKTGSGIKGALAGSKPGSKKAKE